MIDYGYPFAYVLLDRHAQLVISGAQLTPGQPLTPRTPRTPVIVAETSMVTYDSLRIVLAGFSLSCPLHTLLAGKFFIW